MRVYVPSTLPALGLLLATGELSQSVRGFAVTPALREWYSSGDLEELEYIALTHAARASLRLLHEDPSAARRRVVLAAEVPAELVVGNAGFDEPALVEVKKPVLLRHVMSGHIDDPAAAPEIAAAADALPAADDGDDDAQFAVDSAEGHELLWYATQELRRYLAEGDSALLPEPGSTDPASTDPASPDSGGAGLGAP
jgi:hypothetical protein